MGWIVPIALCLPLAFCIGASWGAGKMLETRPRDTEDYRRWKAGLPSEAEARYLPIPGDQ